ncbi:MAG: phosphoenolpyruvate hydrolase family protein [Actinomycetota bacterium]
MARMKREEVLARLRDEVTARRPIIGTGAGIGLSAKFAESAGADLILVYNSGRFRMAGHGSNAGLLAIGDANGIVLEMGEREILPVVSHTPVIAGVNGTDPTRDMAHLLHQVDELGYSGVINFPSHGIIDGRWRESLEATGFGYDREVAMIAEAHRQQIFTMAYVFTPDEARRMVDVGVDVVVAHMGLTVGGSIGAPTDFARTLDAAVADITAIDEAARQAREDVLVVCHGGPVATAEDVEFVLARCDAVGFIGASSVERLPVEQALEATVAAFKDLRLSP